MLVIAGILIALWINGWMEDRKDARHTLRFNPTTCTDLTGTGDIRLIRNRARRDQVTKYYENTERAGEIIERNKIWQRGSVAQMASQQPAGLDEEFKAARSAVGDELARRRWPTD